MRTVIVYKQDSDHARQVIDYLRDFRRFKGQDLEEINPDSRDGSFFCRVYDVVEYPTVLALSDSGEVQQIWRGLPLPLMDELSFYKNSDQPRIEQI